MVRKKLALAILALSALQADLASALGLGSLSVKSSLNQPLNAEIRLLDTGDLDPSQIKIRLAAPEDFERAGVDRNFFLTNLKFTVDMDGRGSGTVRVTTRDPVVEPYLNFVVEARWPSGRLLREFAVLLDPPTFSGGAAQPAPRVATAAPAPSVQPVRELEPPRVTSEGGAQTAERIESSTLPESSNPGEHRVQVGETLSQIAGRARPADDVTTEQTMLAIQRANPDAFIQSNINLIRAGAILRLPSADEARAVGAAEAGQQIADQSHAWRSGTGASEAATGPQLDASQPATSAEGGYQERERLTIATPGNSDKATVGEGSGGSQKGLQALRNQLAASQEGLDSAKRENEELQSRLDAMEEQMATLKRLVAIKDDQLAALQDKGVAQAATAPAATPAETSEPAVAQTPAATAPAPAAAAPTPAPAPVAAKPKPVVKPAPQPVPEHGLIEKITSNPLYLGGGLAALLLAIGGAVFAKKRRERAEEEAAAEFDLRDYSSDHGSRDDVELEAPLDFDADRIGDESVAAAEAEGAPAVAEPEKKAVRSETGDAIAEADIYIAYGRYQQAVDLLSGAIDAEPTRSDLRIKLLEVLLEMRDRDAFRQQFMALQSLGDAGAVAQVKDMLSSVEGVSDWLDDLPAGGASSVAPAVAAAAAVAATSLAAVDTDLDDELIQDDPSEALAESDLELDLDLDDSILDAPLQTASFEGEAVAPAPDAAATDLDLDFELDLDGAADELPDDFGAALESDAGSLAVDIDTGAQAGELAPGGDLGDAADGDELTLDLDDSELELDLDLNEDDLDFALRAMGEGEAPAADAAPVADDLVEFDLSLDEEVPVSAGVSAGDAERLALEAELGDLGDLEGLDELSFDELAVAADTSTTSLDDEPAFAELAPEPASVPVEAPVVGGDDFDFLADTDEVATKLDLARAYIDMGDADGAKDILDEVLQEGSDVQKQEASELLDRIV
ncbi:MAG: FimV/HubP family polar landmark protein [Ectothiorhodospiraceae bacterium]|jgi:pilus assembly protein FimV|nr:FimV/HubP family polar landmark protein [Ectothiorhodospiraceae bacterium]